MFIFRKLCLPVFVIGFSTCSYLSCDLEGSSPGSIQLTVSKESEKEVETQATPKQQTSPRTAEASNKPAVASTAPPSETKAVTEEKVEVVQAKPENTPKVESIPSKPSTESKIAALNPPSQSRDGIAVFFPSVKDQLTPKSLFFQANIGVGFLYFSGVKGNLMGEPVIFFQPATNWRDIPLKGRLMYNKTPLYEYILGYRINAWSKIGLSYQHQGGVLVQTKPLRNFRNIANSYGQWSSQLSLDAFLIKVYFEPPYAAVYKNTAISPYLAMGVGPGWQSWTFLETNYMRGATFLVSAPMPLRNKISANAVWMIDSGLRLQSFSKDPSFTVLLGCKYNQWGQARSMGQMRDQGSSKFALSKAMKIKTVYQFSPYMGFQWNFTHSALSKSPNTLDGKNTNVWLPYFVHNRCLSVSKKLMTSFNVGLGVLYFSGVRGNIMVEPSESFFSQVRFVPIKGRLTKTKTPLFEYLIGYQFSPWLKLAFSYQNQASVFVQSKRLHTYRQNSYAFFKSNLNLDATLIKVYFQSPYAVVMKNFATTPYLAVGVGPGWQSWTSVQGNYITTNDLFGQIGFNASGGPLNFKQKFSANAVWMLDTGLLIQGAYANASFSATIGCKYNQWGQARSIGKKTQQPSLKYSFLTPVSIKTVYQFAPYLGVQWNFKNSYTSKSPYTLAGNKTNCWIPFFTKRSNFQCPNGFISQFNVGIGFLYFSGLSGNLMGLPANNLNPARQWRDVPLKGRLAYNRTPLYEYQFGYQFVNWFRFVVSYQHQSSVAISTKALQAFPTTANSKGNVAQLQSNLALDAILAKVYFELPFAMIWRGLATSPYLAVGVGPGWQSWTRVRVDFLEENRQGGVSDFIDHVLPVQSKVSANAVWGLDTGVRIQTAYPQSAFSVLLGCKYNQWGQARNLGLISQQKSYKIGLFKPLRIKTVYQFAPYLGVQWNF